MLKPILIAEDSEYDVLELTRVLTKARVENQVLAVTNGVEVIKYLTGREGYANRNLFPLPGVIFLDVTMPEMNGFAVLKWIKNTPAFAAIPIVVLTGAIPLRDAAQAYLLGAASFLSKPCRVEDVTTLPDVVLQSLRFTPPDYGK